MDVKWKVSTYHKFCYKLNLEGFTKYGAVKVWHAVLRIAQFFNLLKDFHCSIIAPCYARNSVLFKK